MDQTNNQNVLVINSGSSSLKLALFKATENPQQFFAVEIENIGFPDAILSVISSNISESISQPIKVIDHLAALNLLIEKVRSKVSDNQIRAISHRIVHGGPNYYQPTIISKDLIDELNNITYFDPVHLPLEIKIIEAVQEIFIGIKQIACFDTAFHHDLPTVARTLPIPNEYSTKGLRRFGFHGLSCSYIMTVLADLSGAYVEYSRIIIAHLGSGVSLTAVKDGKSVETTMGMTPASGVMMSTRAGDLDPGLGMYLFKTEGMDPVAYNDLINFKSGLQGVSGATPDMKKLLEVENDDVNAKTAIDLFCYSIKKSIGSLSTALGGLDTLVFTGGMGENSSVIRQRICAGLDFLGLDIDKPRNSNNNGIISAEHSRVTVRVIHTDECLAIARLSWGLIKNEG